VSTVVHGDFEWDDNKASGNVAMYWFGVNMTTAVEGYRG
jgi:hypothetical protein